MPRPLYDRHPKFKKLSSVSGDNNAMSPSDDMHPSNIDSFIPTQGANVMNPPKPSKPTKAPKMAKSKQAKPAPFSMPKPVKNIPINKKGK